jgi:SPP1 family predicted phage head-tail adaptor
MKIESGKLDRKLELLTRAAVRDELGQEISSFESVITIWAERLEMRTQDAARAGGRETFAMARYLIRWRDNLDTGMRIRTDGKLYDVLGIEEPDRRTTMIITLEEATR